MSSKEKILRNKTISKSKLFHTYLYVQICKKYKCKKAMWKLLLDQWWIKWIKRADELKKTLPLKPVSSIGSYPGAFPTLSSRVPFPHWAPGSKASFHLREGKQDPPSAQKHCQLLLSSVTSWASPNHSTVMARSESALAPLTKLCQYFNASFLIRNRKCHHIMNKQKQY